jgi:hypothetical protein
MEALVPKVHPGRKAMVDVLGPAYPFFVYRMMETKTSKGAL